MQPRGAKALKMNTHNSNFATVLHLALSRRHFLSRVCRGAGRHGLKLATGKMGRRRHPFTPWRRGPGIFGQGQGGYLLVHGRRTEPAGLFDLKPGCSARWQVVPESFTLARRRFAFIRPDAKLLGATPL